MSAFLAAVEAASHWLGLAAFGLGVAALIWLAALQRRVRTVSPDIRRLVRDMEGKRGREVVADLLGNMEFLASRIARAEGVAEQLGRRLSGTIEHKGLIRYNADAEVGGELSFALALLDGDYNGVVLTSIHTLEECRLYVRGVEQGKCAHDLDEEEAAALDIALGKRQPDPEHSSRSRRPRWRARERARSVRDQSTRKRGEERGE